MHDQIIYGPTGKMVTSTGTIHAVTPVGDGQYIPSNWSFYPRGGRWNGDIIYRGRYRHNDKDRTVYGYGDGGEMPRSWQMDW